MMNVAFKIPKNQLAGLYEWLAAVPLAGRESRERTKFLALLAEGIKELEADRLKIVDQYAELDPETQEKKKVVDNGKEHFVIPDDKQKEFSADIEALYAEDFVLDALEGNKTKILSVRDILLNTDYKFGPQEGDTPEQKFARIREAAQYDIWCTAFEAVSFDE